MTTDAIREAIQLQYDKATSILAEVIDSYDDSLWYDSDYQAPAWRVAYHAIFYTNIYCSPTAQAIERWSLEREDAESVWPSSEAPDAVVAEMDGFTRSEMRDYLDHVRAAVPRYLAQFDPGAQCWPDWYDENQLEFHFNNLRHLQHHTAELIERANNVSRFPYPWR